MLSKTLRTILETSAEASKTTGPSLELLREVWPTLLGEPLCHRTRPSGWDNGTLVVGVATDAWRTEMRRNRRQILRRIRARLPWRVDALDFVIEDLPASPARSAPQQGEDDAYEPLLRASDADFGEDSSIGEDLDRLDAQTQDLVLRIKRHIDQGT